MKKLVLVTFSLVLGVIAFAQSNTTGLKGTHIKVSEANNADEQVVNHLRQSGNGASAVRIEEKDCADYHLGTILFHNQTSKDLTISIDDPKKEEVKSVTVPVGKSVYVNNIEIGEYNYRKSSDKKSKKKNIVNVIECSLKTIVLDDKNFK